MTRIKRGTNKKRSHKKILNLAKGHRGSRSNLFRQANESVLHALMYNYIHNKTKKRNFRRLWNVRINAAAREHGISYSVFISGLKKSGIEIDRKTLSDMAINEPVGFQQLVEKAKSSIN